ncbi:hypothetical protein HDU96_005348 [Phlyctochytrium bullatum]|nr:hypothetical protein HDU96_005348 [Phlyctochytrium bullatum]
MTSGSWFIPGASAQVWVPATIGPAGPVDPNVPTIGLVPKGTDLRQFGFGQRRWVPGTMGPPRSQSPGVPDIGLVPHGTGGTMGSARPLGSGVPPIGLVPQGTDLSQFGFGQRRARQPTFTRGLGIFRQIALAAKRVRDREKFKADAVRGALRVFGPGVWNRSRKAVPGLGIFRQIAMAAKRVRDREKFKADAVRGVLRTFGNRVFNRQSSPSRPRFPIGLGRAVRGLGIFRQLATAVKRTRDREKAKFDAMRGAFRTLASRILNRRK